MHWYDRSTAKDKLLTWLESDSNSFLLHLNNDPEIEDVTTWIGKQFDNNVVSYLNSDEEFQVYKVDFIKEIVNQLDDKSFSGFKKKYNQMCKSDASQIIFKQSVGNDSTFKSNTEIKKIKQSIILGKEYDFYSARLEEMDREIGEFLNEFTQGLRKINRKSKLLIVVNLGGQGFTELSRSHQNWLTQKFIPSVMRISNVKLLFNTISTDARLEQKFTPVTKVRLNDVSFDEALKEASKTIPQKDDERYIKGLITGLVQGKETVEYTKFKTTIEKELFND